MAKLPELAFEPDNTSSWSTLVLQVTVLVNVTPARETVELLPELAGGDWPGGDWLGGGLALGGVHVTVTARERFTVTHLPLSRTTRTAWNDEVPDVVRVLLALQILAALAHFFPTWSFRDVDSWPIQICAPDGACVAFAESSTRVPVCTVAESCLATVSERVGFAAANDGVAPTMSRSGNSNSGTPRQLTRIPIENLAAFGHPIPILDFH